MDISQCNSCQHEVKGIARFCPLCNGSMKLAVKDGERNCPKCQVPLEIHHFNHHDIDTCNSCSGMWIEPETFRVLTTEFDVYKDPDVSPIFNRPGYESPTGYLACACCSKLMVRQNYKSISGVMIDLCINCGVWLDQGELKLIRNFIAAGGLDQAQDHQLEKQHQRQNELDKLGKRVSDLEFMDRMMNRYDSKWLFYKFIK